MVISRTRCPVCAHKGADVSRDNLANYSDGHSYCFGCGYHKPTPLLTSLKNKLQDGNPAPDLLRCPGYNGSTCTFRLPAKAIQWLYQYGITDDEIHHNQIWYDLEKDLLVFPIYDGIKLVCTNGRYFGADSKYSKYHTKGNKNGHFKLFPQPKSNVYVLVEDYVSAIKVGRWYNCIPLLGCSVPLKLILSLISSRPTLRIWLDPDKHASAVKESNRSRQFIDDCGTILTSKDPKEYDDEQIREHVESTLGCSQGITRSSNVSQVP